MATRPPEPLRPIWQAIADRHHEVRLAVERYQRAGRHVPIAYHLQQATLALLLLPAPFRRR